MSLKNHINNNIDSIPPYSAGGNKKECIKEKKIGEKLGPFTPDGDTMRNRRHVDNIYYNIDELNKPRIDNSKLLIPLYVDRSKYDTHEELYHAISEWWENIKDNSPKTIQSRIRYARSMANHSVYPVDWFEFIPEQILNQLIYRQKIEYKEIAEKKGIPTFGYNQLKNYYKTVNTFAQAYGIDISYWGWSPPSPPEPQVKIVPRPITVNKLIHHWYTNNRYENALIRSLLTVGFHIGTRPEELITIKASNVKLTEGYLLITEQKKKYRNRQIWLDNPVLYSRQQNSLNNFIKIWRPQVITEESNDILFIQKNGKPFPSEDAFRMYLAPFVKPVWNDFKPKIMRDWSAIARLIRTKVETKKWDTRTVKNALGHKYEKTTEDYIKYAEDYFRKDPYDWLRAVLKFHKNSRRMRRLMKKENGPSQKQDLKILTKQKNRPLLRQLTGGALSAPDGVKGLFLLLKISTNDPKNWLLIRLYYSLKSFFYSFSFFVDIRRQL